MAQTSFPFDTINTTETQYSTLFSRLQSNGVWAHPGAGELLVSATTGLALSVAPGIAYILGRIYSNDAPLTVTLDAGDANPRIDIVVLRMDPSLDSIVAAVVKGSPAVSPVAPALTQTDAAVHEIALAQVAVAASAASISSGNITDKRRLMDTGSGLWTTGLRPTAPRLGKNGFNITLGYSEEWNGSAWQPTGLPPVIDADTVGGRSFFDGTVAPVTAFGNDDDVFFVWEA